MGKQTITDTGPLTRKPMETIEDDLLARSLEFIDRGHQASRPFLLWHNTTRMHVWTRQPPDFNPQGMVEAVLQAAAQRQGN